MAFAGRSHKGVLLLSAVAIAGLSLWLEFARADQAGCDLGTYNVSADECQITGAVTTTGTKNFHHSVRMMAGSSINASGGGITLNVTGATDLNFTMEAGATVLEANDDVATAGASASAIAINTSGDMTMNAGSKILAENNTNGGSGNTITIDVGGDMTMAGASGALNGAVISTRKTAGAGDTGVGGNIAITVGDDATATGTFFMGGGSTTYGAETGAKLLATGTGPAGDISVRAGHTFSTEPGSVIEAGDGNGTAIQQGGKIDLVSQCGLTSKGRVTSKGTDPGGDLVHIEACDALIAGLVESTGKAHSTGIKNSCDEVNDSLTGEVIRSGKPANSTGCIEVWANNITVDSSGTNAGELNADTGSSPGGVGGTSWIDLFAFTDITIVDGTGNNHTISNGVNSYLSTFAVHANSPGGSDMTPSTVTAKAKTGSVTGSGDTLAAMTTANGSDGGFIFAEAAEVVTLDGAKLSAAGDFVAGGAIGNGGQINVRSYSGDVSWKNGEGDVRPPDGSIFLTACGTIDTTGTNFNGEVPVPAANCSPAQPSLPTYVGTFFDSASRWDICNPAGKIQLFKKLDPNTDPGRFNLFIKQGATVIDSEANAGDGGSTDEKTVPTGLYDVSETGGTVPVTSLADYQKSIKCIDTANGDEVVLDQAADDADASVQVDAGDDIVCTITNTRETGKIQLFKKLDPNTDPGRFNLFIKQGATVIDSEANAGDGGSTDEKTVPTGLYDVSETGGTVPVTSLADYQKSIKCIDTANGDEVVLDQAADDADASVQVDAGDDIVCTITNTRETGKIQLFKKLDPNTDPGRSTSSSSRARR